MVWDQIAVSIFRCTKYILPLNCVFIFEQDKPQMPSPGDLNPAATTDLLLRWGSVSVIWKPARRWLRELGNFLPRHSLKRPWGIYHHRSNVYYEQYQTFTSLSCFSFRVVQRKSFKNAFFRGSWPCVSTLHITLKREDRSNSDTDVTVISQSGKVLFWVKLGIWSLHI